MKKAHKIRIYPNSRQEIQFQKTFGCVRFYWNFLLDQRITNDKMKKENPEYIENKLTYAGLKKQEEFSWLKEVEAQPLSQVNMDLNKAYKNTFNSKFGFPKFKSKKYSKKSYRTAVGMKVNGRYFYVSKVGWVKMAEELRFKGKLMNVTISQTKSGKYFATFLVDAENFQQEPVANNIGLDLGLTHFCITSAGEKIDNNRFYRSLEQQLIREQRKLSRAVVRANWRRKDRHCDTRLALEETGTSGNNTASARLLSADEDACRTDAGLCGHLAGSTQPIRRSCELYRRNKDTH